MMDRNGPTKKTDTSSYGFDFYGINVSAAQNL